MNAVDTFKIKVNNTIDSAKDAVIIIGRLMLFSVRLPPIIIGRRGRTQGARMVSIPARNDIGSSSIFLFVILSGW